jgi:hypothetical protein
VLKEAEVRARLAGGGAATAAATVSAFNLPKMPSLPAPKPVQQWIDCPLMEGAQMHYQNNVVVAEVDGAPMCLGAYKVGEANPVELNQAQRAFVQQLGYKVYYEEQEKQQSQ